MTRMFPWRSTISGKALILGALLTVAVPGTAYANTVSVTVKSPGATSGPASANSEISTHADCSSGLISGGGINQAIGTGAGVNGNHVNGTSPSPDGTTEYTVTPGVVGTDVTHWLAFGGSGGNASPAFSTTSYAMCLSTPRIRHTQVVMSKVVGPSTQQSAKLAVATCPTGTALLGGGARATPASVGSLKPIASFPTFNDAAHDFGQKPAANGETNPDSWTAAGGIGGGHDDNNTTYAYAICTGDRVNISGITTKMHFREVADPTEGGTGQTATVGCADDKGQDRNGRGPNGEQGDRAILISGRRCQRRQSDDERLHQSRLGRNPPQRSFPSDPVGNPVSDGSTTAAYWTAAIHAGGSPSPNTYSDVWALCLTMHREHRSQ